MSLYEFLLVWCSAEAVMVRLPHTPGRAEVAEPCGRKPAVNHMVIKPLTRIKRPTAPFTLSMVRHGVRTVEFISVNNIAGFWTLLGRRKIYSELSLARTCESLALFDINPLHS